MLTFYKYQGAGNDFLIIDNRKRLYNVVQPQIEALCNRRFGIGADGLMLLEDHPEADFAMRYFNSDGNEATMCGNGGRCIVAFANKLGIIGNSTTFMAVDGLHKATLGQGNSVSLEMQPVETITTIKEGYFLNTGSPHVVQFIHEPMSHEEVVSRGRTLRYDKRFAPEGTNVNFVLASDDELRVWTYERGVENETLACGTGVTAAAISAHKYLNTDKNSFNIRAKGGNLHVSFAVTPTSIQHIWLTGPATYVFKGEIPMP
ncbi:MAG: diaminopimelate epimerase [Bacteroidota bacterium]